MKITKRHLRRIIREEKRKILKEQATHAPGEAEGELEFAIDEYIRARSSEGITDPSQVHREVVSILDRMIDDADLGGEIDASRYITLRDPTGRIPQEDKMRIAKRQLRRIIKEEKRKLLSEQGGWGDEEEHGSSLIYFAQAWTGLGGAVQEQVVAILAAWERGGHEPDWAETVYEQNPNAIDMAVERLGSSLRDLGEEGEYIWDALEEAQKIYRQGEAEVEADARAAGDIP